jgi:hypothetical protein|tara:strand:+ start:4033 stop:4371 length:339 start_codon:yes stop_codon:yes gene_type:complete
MKLFFLLYILVGIIEYFRVQKEYRKKIQEDFPFHQPLFIEMSLWVVCILFTVPLQIIKLYYVSYKFFKNIYRKLTFVFRMKKFVKDLENVSKEKNSKKSVELLFKAMKDIVD